MGVRALLNSSRSCGAVPSISLLKTSTFENHVPLSGLEPCSLRPARWPDHVYESADLRVQAYSILGLFQLLQQGWEPLCALQVPLQQAEAAICGIGRQALAKVSRDEGSPVNPFPGLLHCLLDQFSQLKVEQGVRAIEG